MVLTVRATLGPLDFFGGGTTFRQNKIPAWSIWSKYCALLYADGQLDPPIIVVGFTGNPDPPKDSLRNILETGECVVNTVSEYHLEAVNHCSINVPHGISEFELSGLHPAPCTTVKAPRVKESIFSIETKLVETKEWNSRANPGKKSGVMVILEGTRFWAREDAIDDERSLLDPAVLRPVARLVVLVFDAIPICFGNVTKHRVWYIVSGMCPFKPFRSLGHGWPRPRKQRIQCRVAAKCACQSTCNAPVRPLNRDRLAAKLVTNRMMGQMDILSHPVKN
ncbi:flavoprotein oxygenase [Histoplasma capsulatum H143]|uniref:Flavoprotein oxygenase n=1 Tax=Ajellomyces capsulatus (strain H143) TaxID=544712 RepID=C6HNM7_AJECH|nr:flavoprotein oxygenase [Histoplasma capsulatum H143]